MTTKTEQKKPKGPIANGQTVKWQTGSAEPQQGKVLAFLPVGKSVNDVAAEMKLSLVGYIWAGGNPRYYARSTAGYLVAVERTGAKGQKLKPELRTPQAVSLEAQNPRAKRA